MKKFSLFFLLAALAVFTVKADDNILTVSGAVYENPNSNPVPDHTVMIEIPPSNIFEGYYNEVLTNDAGEYFDEIVLPEIVTQGELHLSTIDCNGDIISEMFYFSPNAMNFTYDFFICDEPFPDCQAMFE